MTIGRQMDKLTVCGIFCGAFLLSPTLLAKPPATLLRANWSFVKEFQPGVLFLNLYNTQSRAICIPKIQIMGPILQIQQSGKEIYPKTSANRAVLDWRGMDLIEGMLVVPPHRSISVMYELEEWNIEPGLGRGKLSFPEFDCADIFQTEKPQFKLQNTTVKFTALARPAR